MQMQKKNIYSKKIGNEQYDALHSKLHRWMHFEVFLLIWNNKNV